MPIKQATLCKQETTGASGTLLHTHQLDAIVTLGWLSFAPIFGNPSLCTPEGWLEGQPKGLVWVGKKHDDGTLLQLGHAYYEQSKLSS